MSQNLRCPQVSRRFQAFWLVAFLLVSVLLAGPASAARFTGSALFTSPLVDDWPAASDTHCPSTRKFTGSSSPGGDGDVAPAWQPGHRTCSELTGQSRYPELSARGRRSVTRYILPSFRAPPTD